MIYNNKTIHRIHFVGIKGVAMTALAVVAKELGLIVTGSDVLDHFPTDDVLNQIGILPQTGFSINHIDSTIDLVIYTGAHGGKTNLEVLAALQQGICTLPHGKALGFFMSKKRQISVAGCHGKTTTSALTASIFRHAGVDASYAVGSGMLGGLGLPAHAGHGDWFIAEADEYVTDPVSDLTPRFLWQNPEVLVVTNIDYDHPDVYSSLSAVFNAYQQLANKVPLSGYMIISSDDQQSKNLKTKGTLISVGTDKESTFQVHFDNKPMTATILKKGKFICTYEVQIPGRHMLTNAAMAIVAGITVGITVPQAVNGVKEFTGAKRRFETIGIKNNVKFYDDYAHHPTEIQATIAAAKELKRRIVVVFQPHTYSRTKALFYEFSRAFFGCDEVVITDIYASARENDSQEISSQMLVTEIQKGQKARYAKGKNEVVILLRELLNENDIVLFMGAGDIYNWEKEVIENL